MSQLTKTLEMAEQLIEAGQRFDTRGWVPGGGGNFSARLSEDRFLLTASGRHKGKLTMSDFIVVDEWGEPEEEGQKPSAETLLHCERYRMLPEVNCVLHTHSPKATVLSRMIKDDELTVSGFEMQKGLPGIETHATEVDIPIFENDQDIDELANWVSHRHKRQPFTQGYIIRGHGIYAWGESVMGAVCAIEALEFLIECAAMERMQS